VSSRSSLSGHCETREKPKLVKNNELSWLKNFRCFFSWERQRLKKAGHCGQANALARYQSSALRLNALSVFVANRKSILIRKSLVLCVKIAIYHQAYAVADPMDGGNAQCVTEKLSLSGECCAQNTRTRIPKGSRNLVGGLAPSGRRSKNEEGKCGQSCSSAIHHDSVLGIILQQPRGSGGKRS
jgi:hypothetical protein